MKEWRRYVAEAVGTFTLVVVGPGAAMVSASTQAFGHTGVALAFGLVIAFVVAATGHLSGAHINPAVTIAFWSVRRFPGRDVLPYVAAQCLGAAIAAFGLLFVLGPVGGLGATIPTVSLGRAFVIELVYSAILAFVIMGVATDERSPAGVAPFALGATVFAGALVTGPLTGGSFNPARSLGPALAGGGWTAHWLYWAAPIIGMVVAMHLYDRLRPALASAVPKGRRAGRGRTGHRAVIVAAAIVAVDNDPRGPHRCSWQRSSPSLPLPPSIAGRRSSAKSLGFTFARNAPPSRVMVRAEPRAPFSPSSVASRR